MATVVTLDDDVSALVEQEAKRAGQTAAEAVNRVLKMQLRPSVEKGDIKPFVVHPVAMNLPPEWTNHKVEDLLDLLEGTDRKW